MGGEFRLIMLRHAFEHMPEPRAVLADVARLLHPSGTARIRIPLAGSEAWETYGTDWVQLDAPRPLYLHTPESIRRLADQTALHVTDVLYDSTGFQFWGSEQYRRGVTLFDPRSHGLDGEGAIFSPAEMKEFERRAMELNRIGRGDSACLLLTRRTPEP